MAQTRLPFKTSRALAAYIRANCPEGLDPSEILPHKSTGSRRLPNVTIIISDFAAQQDNPGACDVTAIVSVRTALTGPYSEYESEDLVGAVEDLFTVAIGTDRSTLADAITTAGRTLAVDESDGEDPEVAARAERDADMALFKVDSIIPGRGHWQILELGGRLPVQPHCPCND